MEKLKNRTPRAKLQYQGVWKRPCDGSHKENEVRVSESKHNQKLLPKGVNLLLMKTVVPVELLQRNL